MPSVADILQHELFSAARVVAGSAGLGREVRWVHNAGVPDAPQWLNGGELVMTTILNMPQEIEEQREYVRQMAAKDVAGLVLTVGRYIDTIPDHLCEAAESCDFPLIEIPYTTRFVDIAKAINERISQSSLHMIQRALDIHQTLTTVVLEGGGLKHLAEKLAQLIGHSISIETDRFDAIATANISKVDEARRYTQLHGRTDPRLVDALEKRGVLPAIRSTLRPYHLQVMPDVGLELERLLAPIVVHGEIYGFVWIIADDHELSEIDMMAIESGAMIAALMMLYQESVQSAEASLKGSLLSQLLQGDGGRETILTDQSLRYGVDLRSRFVLLVIDCKLSGSQKLTTLYRAINQLIAADGWQAVVGQFAGQVVVLAQHNQQIETLAARMQERVMLSKLASDGRPRIGVSSPQQGSHAVKLAYDQCQDALAIMRRLEPTMRVVHFNDLGYLHALYHAGAAMLHSNPNVPLLRRLLEEKQADLLVTLEAYLDQGGNGVSTAEALHIHRSTLNYRLQRIVQLCGVDLQDPITRTNLQVALKLLRLFDDSPTA